MGLWEDPLSALKFLIVGFDGEFDETSFPWCTPREMSIGIKRSALPTPRHRFTVFERDEGNVDMTMQLLGSGANGPALTLTGTGGSGLLGWASRDDAHTSGSKSGDLALVNGVKSSILLQDKITSTAEEHIFKIKSTGESALEMKPTFSRHLKTLIVGPDTTGGLSASIAAGSATILVDTPNYDLGIGETAVLESGLFVGNSLTTPKASFYYAGNWNAGVVKSYGSDSLYLMNDDDVLIGMLADGKVGIGTKFPAERLHVTGGDLKVDGKITVSQTLTATGNIVSGGQVISSSDRRLKRDVVPLSSSLDKLLSLKGVSYYWKDPNRSTERQIGLVAQDVQKVFPELVQKDHKGFLAVAYQNLVAPLIEAIRELWIELGNHEGQIQEHEKVLQELKKQIEILSEKVEACRQPVPSR